MKNKQKPSSPWISQPHLSPSCLLYRNLDLLSLPPLLLALTHSITASDLLSTTLQEKINTFPLPNPGDNFYIFSLLHLTLVLTLSSNCLLPCDCNTALRQHGSPPWLPLPPTTYSLGFPVTQSLNNCFSHSTQRSWTKASLAGVLLSSIFR